ncbi:unnamed protein product [Paramecium octaurelia]|uniref:Uncharacterized protein n=1 Tax=Paramecium octaurelia TaxID=43137 RepID=A0A8S1XE68_PAROT|nr:unnamed protein product [Paramecium octaurelia]
MPIFALKPNWKKRINYLYLSKMQSCQNQQKQNNKIHRDLMITLYCNQRKSVDEDQSFRNQDLMKPTLIVLLWQKEFSEHQVMAISQSINIH